MKNEREKIILFWLSFCRLFNAWKTVGTDNCVSDFFCLFKTLLHGWISRILRLLRLAVMIIKVTFLDMSHLWPSESEEWRRETDRHTMRSGAKIMWERASEWVRWRERERVCVCACWEVYVHACVRSHLCAYMHTSTIKFWIKSILNSYRLLKTH